MDKIKIARLRSTKFIGGPGKSILTFATKTTECDITLICFEKLKGENNDFINSAKELRIKTECVLMKSPFDFGSINRLAYLLKERNIQILHTHGYKENIIGYFAAKKAGIKVIAMVHGWTGHTIQVKFYELIDKILLRSFDKIIIVSEFIRKNLLKIGIPENKIISIHNAIDFSAYDTTIDNKKVRCEFSIKTDEILIGTVGRLSKEKGHKYFIEAAAQTLKTFPNTKFMIVGDGPERNNLISLSKELNIYDKIIFTGRRNDINFFFSAFDIFVLPSLREVLPNVILEAFMYKKPVVATNVGGVQELIMNNTTGLISESKDVSALASNMQHIIENPEKANEMGQKGFELINKEFSAEDRVLKIENLYKEVLK